ncbi:MAG: replication-associated recombination protein A [Thermodesulfobacteriota bacterium]
MRPSGLDEVVGQAQAVGPGGILRRAAEEDRPFSMILWGPPGCGKTTLARIIAQQTSSIFVSFSAVGSGVQQIREVVAQAKESRARLGKKTVLFVDEIHRFNKAQQDGFLPHVESGLITLVGATTENPSFEVNAPLLSRCRVVVLYPLSAGDIEKLLARALEDKERGLSFLSVAAEAEALSLIADAADGDARRALNALENAAFLCRPDTQGVRTITREIAETALQKKTLRYDKAGEEHYNLISALHKSLRGSDPDASLYWLERMLTGGEDPLYLARRMVRFAVEDVGMADPHALTVAMAAMNAYHFLGSPEGELALYQAAAYLATAPKSNALYMARYAVKEAIEKTGSLPVPLHIRNAPTKLMKDLGYGKGYQYAHDHPHALAAQENFPPELSGRVFYEPTDRGYEKIVKDRLFRWREYLKGLKKN